MYHFLDFEKSISVLEWKIEELRNISSKDGLNIGLEVSKLEEQLENKLIKTYSRLTPWDKVKVARHPLRPHPSEIIKNVFTNWQPLAGDRGFKEDNALLGGVAKLGDVPCVVIGIEKGKTVDKRIFHNFGMVRPEGYRKTVRLMKLADKFNIPMLQSLVNSNMLTRSAVIKAGLSAAKEAEWLVSKNKVEVEPLLVLNFISIPLAKKFKSPPVLCIDELVDSSKKASPEPLDLKVIGAPLAPSSIFKVVLALSLIHI